MPRRSDQRPLISANFAITWDGRISTKRRTPSDFSSREDKRRFLCIRAEADAVLVSVRTAAADGMSMGIPTAALRAERKARGQTPHPVRVLVTNSGRIPRDLPVLAKPLSPVVIFSTHRMPERTRSALREKATVHLHSGSSVDLPRLVETLRREHGVRRLHCEGGGELFRSLVAAGLMDRLYLTLCPRVFGSTTAPTLTGAPADFLPASVPCRLLKMEPVGAECFCQFQIG